MTCPTCQSSVQCIITNISKRPGEFGFEFCEHCAPLVCPTYNKHAVLTPKEAAWLRAQGIDPGTSRAEEYVRKLGLGRTEQ